MHLLVFAVRDHAGSLGSLLMTRWLPVIALFALLVYAVALIVDTPKAAPEPCTWGASSIYIDADGQTHGPVVTGCKP